MSYNYNKNLYIYDNFFNGQVEYFKKIIIRFNIFKCNILTVINSIYSKETYLYKFLEH